jgi:hypothetical protein
MFLLPRDLFNLRRCNRFLSEYIKSKCYTHNNEGLIVNGRRAGYHRFNENYVLYEDHYTEIKTYSELTSYSDSITYYESYPKNLKIIYNINVNNEVYFTDSWLNAESIYTSDHMMISYPKLKEHIIYYNIRTIIVVLVVNKRDFILEIFSNIRGKVLTIDLNNKEIFDINNKKIIGSKYLLLMSNIKFDHKQITIGDIESSLRKKKIYSMLS